mmetsp:Transcript_49213/g.111639  ORF Transcript_49213/g.111639 Transcript_49213/m.111639 type:complete len:234 (+) Transcript_49213:176-877(+)|eukprot:CAMPEP_0172604058 /NCGR_PEP_ID=MMETSP1068-20121228/24302_1 /TAXON_ID=35684 /ORGANISM="Pseudopedinella elastica, Strain CCMP716" /LENGTH=233 /DNA_ID=CAMNT_0013405997 /DNA_START=167 /DNA_END=868 /DNA_ORIENTATION=-
MSSLSAAAEKPPDAGVQKGAIAAAMVADSFAMKFAKFIDKTTNGRGIPTVKFLADVEKFMGENKLTIEETIGAYSEMLQMFKLMEGSMTRQKASLKLKMPDIESTLELVLLLKAKRDDEEVLMANYQLSEVVSARARVTCNGTVCLWLGANVMVEYRVEEAIEMLQTNLAKAAEKLTETDEDLGHLKDQITTLEVNMARTFNFNVKLQRQAKGGAKGTAPAKGGTKQAAIEAK